MHFYIKLFFFFLNELENLKTFFLTHNESNLVTSKQTLLSHELFKIISKGIVVREMERCGKQLIKQAERGGEREKCVCVCVLGRGRG